MQATQQGLVQVAMFDTKDGLYDCAWSEVCISETCTVRMFGCLCCAADHAASKAEHASLVLDMMHRS